jgi:hypothetical protein
MATKVVVHERAIQSLFNPGGGVNRFGTRVARETTMNARAFGLRRARTGTLAKSFSTSSRVTHNAVTFTCYSTAPHALHLEYGTRAQTGVVLYEEVVKGLRAPAAAGRYAAFIGARMRRVEGTPRTRFMSRALDKALAKHGLV